MPSYRVSCCVHSLHAGVQPPELEAVARRELDARTMVESVRVDILRSRPYLRLRFSAGDDAEAADWARAALDAVGSRAQIGDCQLHLMSHGCGIPVALSAVQFPPAATVF